MTVLPALAVSSRAARLAELRTEALFVLREQLGEIELACAEGAAVPESSQGSERRGADKLRWDVGLEPVAADPNVRVIKASVYWPRGRGEDEHDVVVLWRVGSAGS